MSSGSLMKSPSVEIADNKSEKVETKELQYNVELPIIAVHERFVTEVCTRYIRRDAKGLIVNDQVIIYMLNDLEMHWLNDRQQQLAVTLFMLLVVYRR